MTAEEPVNQIANSRSRVAKKVYNRRKKLACTLKVDQDAGPRTPLKEIFDLERL